MWQDHQPRYVRHMIVAFPSNSCVRTYMYKLQVTSGEVSSSDIPIYLWPVVAVGGAGVFMALILAVAVFAMCKKKKAPKYVAKSACVCSHYAEPYINDHTRFTLKWREGWSFFHCIFYNCRNSVDYQLGNSMSQVENPLFASGDEPPSNGYVLDEKPSVPINES